MNFEIALPRSVFALEIRLLSRLVTCFDTRDSLTQDRLYSVRRKILEKKRHQLGIVD